MAHAKHIKGDRAELIAAEYFISLVNRTPTKKQKELDVQLIFVDLDTKEVLDIMPSKRDKQVKKVDMTNVVPFERKNV